MHSQQEVEKAEYKCRELNPYLTHESVVQNHGENFIFSIV